MREFDEARECQRFGVRQLLAANGEASIGPIRPEITLASERRQNSHIAARILLLHARYGCSGGLRRGLNGATALTARRTTVGVLSAPCFC